MDLKILNTKNDYRKVLQRFEQVFGAKKGTSESNEVDVLALLIKQYEDRHYVIKAPSPLEAIRCKIEQHIKEVVPEDLPLPRKEGVDRNDGSC